MRLLIRILFILLLINLLSIGLEVTSYTNDVDLKIVVSPGTKALIQQ
ncbi:MAG: hypothetical protein ACREIQ_08765 [Nitrospiria bacterium]